MTLKKRTSFAAVTLVLTMLAPMTALATPATSNSSNLTYDMTQKAVMEKAKLLTETYGTTSVQYALMDEGEIVISGQVGKNDPEDRIPLSSNTMYGIGSTSKMVLTAAVMKLVDEGKIDLDVPVVNYIPDFKMKDNRYTQITPRMLLNHSSGILGTSSGSAILYGDNDTYAHDTLLDQLAEQNLKADPGAYSVYSNDSFTLAEILVEKVSDMSFSHFIQQNFTEPLGMSHTKTPQDLVDPDQMAVTYSQLHKEQLPLENTNMIGSGGIYSTAEDLVKFSQIFTGEVKGILSSESAKAMTQEEYKKGVWPEDSDSSISYGLGWDSVDLFPFSEYGIQAVTKGGNTIAYHSSLIVLPEYNMAAAVTSSGGSSTTDQLIASELLLSALEEKDIIKERKPEKSFGVPVKVSMPKKLTQDAGIYGAVGSSLLKVEVTDEGQLTTSLLLSPNSTEQKYTYTADGSFVNEQGTEKLEFAQEDNGNTYLWSRSYQSVPGLGQIASSEYKAEKLETNTLPEDVTTAWQKREGNIYYLVNEKYTSTVYDSATPIIPIHMFDEAPGYVYTNKIMDANSAVNQLQIPGLAGRDTMEYEFFEKNGVEYVSAGGKVYVSQELVRPLYSGKQSKTTIQTNGYATWYSIPAAAAGKVMTVKMPSKGAFTVYDQTGISTNHTVVSGINEVTLPVNGTIVFAGEAGSKFEITLTNP
ncbi:CubicO group peptidase (beta-lactamase class C family) [Paenibacillus pabuli]|uniref:CubicO group peptidase (Beta-lactamase class C family) n=1 Tax=Paenibacillus pabuli TaxID=1472 RepID=A0A855XNA3_9BACL|nr:CubicO group peptidase (beta-lactamase class C family) [Paenibacillus pabuli]PXV99774.1 CubicO group peptidase (beta-lactamase class C family) [Paenibacillus taichungensis]